MCTDGFINLTKRLRLHISAFVRSVSVMNLHKSFTHRASTCGNWLYWHFNNARCSVILEMTGVLITGASKCNREELHVYMLTVRIQ